MPDDDEQHLREVVKEAVEKEKAKEDQQGGGQK